MIDRETINFKIQECKKKAQKHFFQALAAWMVANLFLAIGLYHFEWFFDLLGNEPAYRIAAVPLIVLPLYTAGIFVLCKATNREFWKRV